MTLAIVQTALQRTVTDQRSKRSTALRARIDEIVRGHEDVIDMLPSWRAQTMDHVRECRTFTWRLLDANDLRHAEKATQRNRAVAINDYHNTVEAIKARGDRDATFTRWLNWEPRA